MTTDPVQLLIEAGAIPASPFGALSRYHGVALARYQRGPNDPGVRYLLRRFIPPRGELVAVTEHIVESGERPELLAARTLGDAELYFQIADANAVTDPFELTDTVGQRVLIPGRTGL